MNSLIANLREIEAGRDVVIAGQVIHVVREAQWHPPLMIPVGQPRAQVFGHRQLVDGLVRRLKDPLTAPAGSRIALYGIPGIGKSTLAHTIATEVAQAFDGGVLWAKLGPQADERTFLHAFALEVGADPRTVDTASATDRKDLIARRVHNRRVLVVADDVCRLGHAEMHLLPGNAVHLFTTVSPDIAVSVAREGAIPVPPLEPEDATAMLKSFAPRAVERFPDLTRELIKAVSGLPLALSLIGGRLSTAAIADHSGPIRQALEVALEGHSEDVDHYIKWAIEPLSEPDQRTLYALSVFRPQPEDFSNAAALHVTDGGAESLYRLISAGLIEGGTDATGNERFSVHKSISEYARRHIKAADIQTAEERMIQYFVDFLAANRLYERRAVQSRIAPEMGHIDDALSRAIKNERYDDMLLAGANSYSEFLLFRGMYRHAEIYLRAALAAAQRLGAWDAAAEASLNLAHHLEKLGNYDQAKAKIAEYRASPDGQNDLRSARACYIDAVLHYNNGDRIAAVTSVANGFDYLSRCEHVRAFADAKDVLHFEREQVQAIRCDLLERRCLLHMWDNKFEDAISDATEGLDLARKLGDQCREAEHLLNWAWVSLEAQDIDLARKKAVEGHDLALRLRHREYEAGFLHRLARVAAAMGELRPSETLFLRALEVAAEIEHSWYVAQINLDFARVLCEQGDARSGWHIDQAVVIAERIRAHKIHEDAEKLRKAAAELTQNASTSRPSGRLSESLSDERTLSAGAADSAELRARAKREATRETAKTRVNKMLQREDGPPRAPVPAGRRAARKPSPSSGRRKR